MKSIPHLLSVAAWFGVSISVLGAAEAPAARPQDILQNGGFEELAAVDKPYEKWEFPGNTLPAGWLPEHTYGAARAEAVALDPGSSNRLLRLSHGALVQRLAVKPAAEERVLDIAFDLRSLGGNLLIRVNGNDCVSSDKLTNVLHRYRAQYVVKPGEPVSRLAFWNTSRQEIEVDNVSALLAPAAEAGAPAVTTSAVPASAGSATTWLQAGAQGLSVTVTRRNGSNSVLRIHPFSLVLKTAETTNGVTTLSRVLPDAGLIVSGLGAELRRYVRPNLSLYKPDAQKQRIAEWDSLPSARSYRFPLTFRTAGDRIECLVDSRYAGSLDAGGGLQALVFSCPPGSAAEAPAFDVPPKAPEFVPLPLAAFRSPAIGPAAAESEPAAGIPFAGRDEAGLDLGTTAGHRAAYASYTFRSAFDGLRESFLAAVPCAQYTRAWVLCALDPDPKKDPSLTARLTRFVPGGGWNGRARESLADTTVRLPRDGEAAPAGFTRAGTVTVAGKAVPLWLAEIVLESGEIQDIIFDDKGPKTHSAPLRENLDFELLGPLTVLAHPFTDARHLPLERPKSGVQVFGVTLEKPAAEMEVRPILPGNIFHNDETPELAVALRARRDGEFVLRWTIRDAEDRHVAEQSRTLSLEAAEAETVLTIPLAQPELGWYGIVFELEQAGRILVKHTASFALLGPDTRQAGPADSPFGTWWYTFHYCPKEPELGAGPLSLKAGLRRNAGAVPDEQTLAPWKVTAASIGWPHALMARNAPDEEIRAFIDEKLAKFPSCTNIMIFHESAQWSYRVAPELIGRKPGPGDEFTNADELYQQAMRLAKLVREHYPQLKIVIGNSLGCSELIAELLRRGFPPAYGDYVGLEVVSRTGQPEKLWAGGQQAGWLMRETARLFGCDWGVASCPESNYRNDRILGQRVQAELYVRDALLLAAYGSPYISVAVLFDTGNNYNSSFWGGTGLCRRYPFLYPKKSYVAMATLTRLLDRAELVRQAPTGSRSVYALEFKRPDGRYVTVLWTGRGTAELTLQLAGNGRYELTDLYGRTRKGGTFWSRKRLALQAGTAAQYLVSAQPIRAIACGRRAYPEDAPPAGLKVVAPMDSAADWKLVPGIDPFLEETNRTELPYRTAGTFALREVEDEEKGRCLEVELAARTNLPAVMSEYTVLRLNESVLVEGEPTTLGLWVKGNSGWGEVYWEIEDANGVRRLACGTTAHGTSVFDYDGRLATINFDGWNFLRMPITDRSPVPDLSTGSIANLWQTSDSGKGVAYPIKITGVAVSLPPRALALTEMEPVRQVIRLKNLSVYE